DFEPHLEPVLIAEEAAYFRPRVARNHRPLLAHRMFHVAVVFRADVLLNVVIRGSEHRLLFDRPWLDVRPWIVNNDFFLQVPEIHPAKALNHVQPLSSGESAERGPNLAVEADCINHESVSLPLPDGMAHPGRIRILRMRAAVHVDEACK